MNRPDALALLVFTALGVALAIASFSQGGIVGVVFGLICLLATAGFWRKGNFK